MRSPLGPEAWLGSATRSAGKPIDPIPIPVPKLVTRATALLVALQETYAVFLYQLVVFARNPSWFAAGMVLLGLVINAECIGIVLSAKALSHLRRLVYGCLVPMRNLTFTRYRVSEFLDSSVHGLIDHSSWRRLLGKSWLVKASVDDSVHLYVVEGPAVIQQLSCYAAPPFLDAYIFITDPPAETRGLRRFFVLHEIGHSQMDFFQPRHGLGVWPYVWLLLWVLFTGAWNPTTLMVGSGYLVMVFWLLARLKRHSTSQRLVSEILADCFALSHLSSDELQRLARNPRLSALRDRDLDERQNATRLARLRENIEWVRQGYAQSVMASAISSVPVPGSAIARLGLFVIIAFTGALPDAATAKWVLILAGVLFVWWTYLGLGKFFVESNIQLRLDGRIRGLKPEFRPGRTNSATRRPPDRRP